MVMTMMIMIHVTYLLDDTDEGDGVTFLHVQFLRTEYSSTWCVDEKIDELGEYASPRVHLRARRQHTST